MAIIRDISLYMFLAILLSAHFVCVDGKSGIHHEPAWQGRPVVHRCCVVQIIRLEGQVTRYKSASENAEKVEDELKVEKRKLQREVGPIAVRRDLLYSDQLSFSYLTFIL